MLRLFPFPKIPSLNRHNDHGKRIKNAFAIYDLRWTIYDFREFARRGRGRCDANASVVGKKRDDYLEWFMVTPCRLPGFATLTLRHHTTSAPCGQRLCVVQPPCPPASRAPYTGPSGVLTLRHHTTSAPCGQKLRSCPTDFTAVGCLVNGKHISNAFAPTPGALKLHAPMLSGSWVSTLCVSDIEPFLSLGVALFCRKFHPFHRTTQAFLHSHVLRRCIALLSGLVIKF